MRAFRRVLPFLLASSLLVCAGCGDDGEPQAIPPPLAPQSLLQIRLREDGRIDLAERDGNTILRGGWAEALVDANGSVRSLSSRDCDAAWERVSPPIHTAAYFAHARGFQRRCAIDGIMLDWHVSHDVLHDTAITRLRVENHAASPARVLRLTPLISEGSEGGLFVGADPARLRILDNGANVALDIDAKLHYPDETRNLLLDALLPIASRGSVVANWNHAVVDLDTQRSWIAGALSVERSFPTLGTRWAPSLPPWRDGHTGLDLIADNTLLFRGKILAAGEAVDSEWMYFAPVNPDPWGGLERYADAVAAWQSFTVWTRRDGGRPVPNGWNSWTGSGGTGGLGTNINEQSMRENLDVMAREFAPFGVDYFQIDDGYQIADGDWEARADRFPSGMAAMSRRIEEHGLLPGLWISAFTIDERSALFAEHPEWTARRRDNVLGPILDPGSGKRVLDLHNDDALDWLRSTMRRYRDDWRVRWLKLDFAYLAFPYAPPESALTAVEAYKRAIRAVRESLGDDVFYLGIGLMGVNYGVVDGMRLTLDNAPYWEEDDPFALIAAGSSFKSTARTGARRYYLHNRVWLNHNDLLFFRTDTSRPQAPLTLGESITLASFMGLTGSIVKFGEDLRTLTPEQIQVWRKLLPSYPATARPLDLFTRMYPEQWSLKIDGSSRGAASSWQVLGLLHWGRNFDYSAAGAAKPIADAPRAFQVSLADLGLSPDRDYLAHEFWSESFLGTVRGVLTHTVPPHGHALIALREATGHPQFLGHNRHFTQGGTDLVEESWNARSRRLRLVFDVDQGAAEAVPFEYRFRIFAPEGLQVTHADVAGGTLARRGSLLTVTLTPEAPQRVTLQIDFQ
jgi:hypothetical protein